MIRVCLPLALAVAFLAICACRATPALAACTSNAIVCENQLPGDPASDWQINGAGDASIQGFATSMSVQPGQTENFKINTPSSNYHIDILRLGYYGGDGARQDRLRHEADGDAAAEPTGVPPRLLDRRDRLRQLGRVGVLDGAERRGLGRIHRPPRPRRLPG